MHIFVLSHEQIERLWQERLTVYREEREKEYLEQQRKIEEAKFKEDIIKREKERLLKEHLPHIVDFVPKGLIQKPEEYGYATKNRFNGTK